MNDVVQEFQNPPAVYRGKPFWAWNGKLSADELRRQIRIMDETGLGGFIMHSRVGFNTEYLSEEWFDMIRAFVVKIEDSSPTGPTRRGSGAATAVCSSRDATRFRSGIPLM